VLYVDDLVDLYFRAVECEPSLKTFIFNVGGGPMQAVSLREVIQMLERELGGPITLRFADWRPGDQRVYVSDISRATEAFGWRPRISVSEGIRWLVEWVRQNRDNLASL
jgi:CDP-paratose 2-epimerase